MKKIIWLASYPKSGNTWFRIFLANLLNGGDDPADINALEQAPNASARRIFDENMGFASSDLSAEEIDRLRPDLYRWLSENYDAPLCMKIHDAYTHLPDGTPLIPTEATFGALYFIRNPLDVVVSFAIHSGWNYDRTLENMSDGSFSFSETPNRLNTQLRQKLFTWSGHVASWVDNAPFPVCVMRYEDMKTNPLETFEKAVRFMELPHTTKDIEKALDHCAFETLQKQEASKGFKEKSPSAPCFFRKGSFGSWRDELNLGQAQRVVEDHRIIMRRFGYLDQNGDIVY